MVGAQSCGIRYGIGSVTWKSPVFTLKTHSRPLLAKLTVTACCRLTERKTLSRPTYFTQKASSHRHARHDADRTVLSCPVWRCELGITPKCSVLALYQPRPCVYRGLVTSRSSIEIAERIDMDFWHSDFLRPIVHSDDSLTENSPVC